MAERRVELLNHEETIDSTIDARIVAIRWDLLMWGLVLDCDVPAFGEKASNAIKRSWVVFHAVDNISLKLDSARLPRGIIAGSSIEVRPLANDFTQFSFSVLTPKYSESDEMIGNPHGNLTITAKTLLVVRSIAIGDFGEFSGDVTQRSSLADDNDFLDAIKTHV